MEGFLLILVSLLIIVIVILLLGKFQSSEPLVDVSELCRTINILKGNLADRETEITRVQHINESFAQANLDDVNKIKALNAKIRSLEDEQDKLRFELSSNKAIVRGLNFKKNELEDTLNMAQEEHLRMEMIYSELYEKCENCEEEIENLNEKIDTFNEIIESKNPFDYVAHLRAHALEHLKEYDGKDIDDLATLFKCQYRLEYLLSIYPELNAYHEDEAYLQYIQEEEQRCTIKKWLSSEEYAQLSEVGREQLAVDRYIANYKSGWTNWEKGRNYEIYVAYILYNEGYDIIQEGLNRKLEDRGRDIIGTHRETGEILIVQCKNWQAHSMIRENVIFQLYGSYMQWLVDNSKSITDNVVPCLYYTCQLSPVAIECAKMLRVRCVPLPLGKFPAIKCNINHGTGQHIYHLPFDRHYDLVKINAKGKGYKFSVDEAIKEGFRRAYNH